MTEIDFFPLIIDYFKKLHLMLKKICTYCFKKKKIIANPCESQSENCMCKKVSAFKKKYKIENRSGGRSSKNTFKSQFLILSTFLQCDRQNCIFFKKLRLFYIEIRLDIFFFEIHNPNKKWLEISVFENSIIMGV